MGRKYNWVEKDRILHFKKIFISSGVGGRFSLLTLSEVMVQFQCLSWGCVISLSSFKFGGDGAGRVKCDPRNFWGITDL